MGSEGCDRGNREAGWYPVGREHVVNKNEVTKKVLHFVYFAPPADCPEVHINLTATSAIFMFVHNPFYLLLVNYIMPPYGKFHFHFLEYKKHSSLNVNSTHIDKIICDHQCGF
jgi:hypothetical protein